MNPQINKTKKILVHSSVSILLFSPHLSPQFCFMLLYTGSQFPSIHPVLSAVLHIWRHICFVRIGFTSRSQLAFRKRSQATSPWTWGLRVSACEDMCFVLRLGCSRTCHVGWRECALCTQGGTRCIDWYKRCLSLGLEFCLSNSSVLLNFSYFQLETVGRSSW